jgi:hypothetical protein
VFGLLDPVASASNCCRAHEKRELFDPEDEEDAGEPLRMVSLKLASRLSNAKVKPVASW